MSVLCAKVFANLVSDLHIEVKFLPKVWLGLVFVTVDLVFGLFRFKVIFIWYVVYLVVITSTIVITYNCICIIVISCNYKFLLNSIQLLFSRCQYMLSYYTCYIISCYLETLNVIKQHNQNNLAQFRLSWTLALSDGSNAQPTHALCLGSISSSQRS